MIYDETFAVVVACKHWRAAIIKIEKIVCLRQKASLSLEKNRWLKWSSSLVCGLVWCKLLIVVWFFFVQFNQITTVVVSSVHTIRYWPHFGAHSISLYPQRLVSTEDTNCIIHSIRSSSSMVQVVMGWIFAPMHQMYGANKCDDVTAAHSSLFRNWNYYYYCY